LSNADFSTDAPRAEAARACKARRAMSTDRTLRVSEVFESVQGEGASAGVSSVFLRLATCNLRCTWCDTKYTWDWSAYDYAREVRTLPIEQVAETLASSAAEHVVVTGGEPLLQQRALSALFTLLPEGRWLEVETNGTLAPLPTLAARVSQWNVSPKLSNSGEPLERRLDLEALRALGGTGRAWLKLVVEAERDLEEIDALLSELSWPRERVLFMPRAASRAELAERTPLVTRLARERGVGTSPRLHVERWDGRRGV
jgi:7-carboxy-7-deazaguanine synthase